MQDAPAEITRPGNRASFSIEHPGRPGLRLRVEIGDEDDKLLTWWQAFSTGDDGQREDLIAQARAEQRERQPPRKRPAARARDAEEAPRPEGGANVAQSEGSTHAEDAPRAKPRRRRRHRSSNARARSQSNTDSDTGEGEGGSADAA